MVVSPSLSCRKSGETGAPRCSGGSLPRSRDPGCPRLRAAHRSRRPRCSQSERLPGRTRAGWSRAFRAPARGGGWRRQPASWVGHRGWAGSRARSGRALRQRLVRYSPGWRGRRRSGERSSKERSEWVRTRLRAQDWRERGSRRVGQFEHEVARKAGTATREVRSGAERGRILREFVSQATPFPQMRGPLTPL